MTHSEPSSNVPQSNKTYVQTVLNCLNPIVPCALLWSINQNRTAAGFHRQADVAVFFDRDLP
jgi:hypothetical protein